MSVSYEDVINAYALIQNHIINTESYYSNVLSEILGCKIIVKYENKQHTGSFKVRGALNKLLSLSKAEKQNGIIAMSAGNHSQGVAYSAKILGIKSTIVMPDNTPFDKIRKTSDLGADVIIYGETLNDAEKHVDSLVKKNNFTKIHPFNDKFIIAGQGTMALEFIEDHPDIDTLLVPVGGGGLIAGCSLIAKHLNKKIEVIGVETELFPSLYNLYNNTNFICGGSTLAEGIAVSNIGKIPLSIIKKNVKEVLKVSENSIEEAVSIFLLKDKVVSEGAGAAGLAAILENKDKFKNKNVGIFLCGGNIDSRVLS